MRHSLSYSTDRSMHTNTLMNQLSVIYSVLMWSQALARLALMMPSLRRVFCKHGVRSAQMARERVPCHGVLTHGTGGMVYVASSQATLATSIRSVVYHAPSSRRTSENIANPIQSGLYCVERRCKTRLVWTFNKHISSTAIALHEAARAIEHLRTHMVACPGKAHGTSVLERRDC